MKPKLYFDLCCVTGILTLISGYGCSSKATVTAEKATAVAKAEVIRRGWNDVEVGDVSFDDGRWSVTLWQLPKTPGGHGTVEVSTNGSIIRFLPGL